MPYKSIPSVDMDNSNVPIDLFSWTASGDSDPSITVNGERKLIATKFEGYGIVPIGFIGFWHKNLTGVPDLPDGWVECNGQVLSDPDSPLNGQTIPNLNGDATGADSPNLSRKEQMFLRGGVTSGTGQDFAIENITGSFTNRRGSSSTLIQSATGAMSRSAAGSDTTVTSDATTQTVETITFDASTVVNTDTETRPCNMTAVIIMRVK